MPEARQGPPNVCGAVPALSPGRKAQAGSMSSSPWVVGGRASPAPPAALSHTDHHVQQAPLACSCRPWHAGWPPCQDAIPVALATRG